jgi:DNA invertase Pin-like site-specific DNA recombinase
MGEKAIIYCRVSSDKQVAEGHGLESQEQRCRGFAKQNYWSVVRAFYDEGVSGGLFDRPAMKALIAYLDAHPIDKYVVIFDDLSRFARNLTVHLKLRTELGARGVILKCLNYNFDDSPEGMFIENVLASKAQLDREQNKRQVIQKMKARMELGYWSLRSPALGLKYAHDPNHGKLLMNDEPYASIYKKAIEKYANNYLNTLEETRQFIQKKYDELGLKRKTSINGTQNILTELLYTGYIEYKPWNVSLRKGKHMGFITMETYKIVQEKIKGKAKPPLRKDYNLDFPLRNYILCDYCQKPMTASWSTGRKNKRYPHYFCKNKGCSYVNKTIRKEKMEKEFEDLLMNVKPSDLTIDIMKDVLTDVWLTSKNDEKSMIERINLQISEKETALKSYMERAIKTNSPELTKMYEDGATKLINDINSLKTSTYKRDYDDEQFGTAYNTVLDVLKEPLKMWKSEDYEVKRTILYMYFEERLCYRLGSGFGTVSLAYPIKLMSNMNTSKNDLVDILSNNWNLLTNYIYRWYPVLTKLNFASLR